MTWTLLRGAADPWTVVSAQAIPADAGVDFELRFRDTYPAMHFRADRPFLFQSSLSEGQP